MKNVILFILAMSLSLVQSVRAHEDAYHPDPILTEHAHMSFEAIAGARYNRRQSVVSGTRNLLEAEFEFNYPFNPQWSVELIIGGGWLFGSGRSLGFSDLEVEGRWAFFDSDLFDLTVALPFVFPSGNESLGLSEARFSTEPTFRADLYLGEFDIYYNLIVGVGLNQRHVELDQRLALTYLWHLSDSVTLAPVAEFRGLVGKGESEIELAGGFGGAWKEWFGVVEFIKPLLDDESPAWSVAFKLGFHRPPVP